LQAPPDGDYFRLFGSIRPTETDSPIATTDSLGSFFIRATSDVLLDSLKLGILFYDRADFLGPAFRPDTLNPRPVYEYSGSSTSIDCSGCAEQRIRLLLPF